MGTAPDTTGRTRPGSRSDGGMQRSLFRLDKYEKLMILIFLVTLPLANPWVRGDGVGYYAYVRSLLIEKSLNFEKDWQHGNDSFKMIRFGCERPHPPAPRIYADRAYQQSLVTRPFDAMGAFSPRDPPRGFALRSFGSTYTC